MYISQRAEPLFADAAGRVLGAARSMALIAQILAITAEDVPAERGADVTTAVRTIGAHFSLTRGSESVAVANAIALMLEGLSKLAHEPTETARAQIAARCRSFEAENRNAVERAAAVGAARLKGASRLYLYDYSSSVVLVLRKLSELGTRATLVIPESSVLDGGYPYVQDLAETHHTLEFIPDCAASAGILGCDAVLEGAESIQADGALVNTIGTMMTAILADYYHVPLFVPSTLIKLDTRTLDGHLQVIHPRPVADLLTRKWPAELRDRVSTPCPNLERVPGPLIAGYFTEVGLLPPAALAPYAMELRTKLRAVMEG